MKGIEPRIDHQVVRHGMLMALLLCTLSGCRCETEQECVDLSKKPLEECRARLDKMQSEINTLKRQLAQALTNPGTIKVDPEVLSIDGRLVQPKIQEGSLTKDDTYKTISQNKPVLKACYERAMKKNASLQRQKITLTIGFRVLPSGVPTGISISPNYDFNMIDCMKKAIRRWQFPPFSGQPVGVESPLTLSPKR